jgi:integrase
MPMSYSGVALTIKATTFSTVGIDVSPHLFRTSVASTAATHSANPHLGAALLHHTDAQVTQEHYNRASSLTAVRKLREVMQLYVTDRGSRNVGDDV